MQRNCVLAMLAMLRCGLCLAVVLVLHVGALAEERVGRIAGQVEFQGEVLPKLAQTESVSGSDKRGLRWVVVLYSPDGADKAPLHRQGTGVTQLTLTRGSLSPFVALAAVGGQIEIVNNDVETAIVKLSGMDLIESDFIEPKSRLRVEVEKPETSPGIFVEEVDGAHRRAWVVAPAVPYAAITNERGEFAIENVPPGHGFVRFWHPIVKFNRVLKHSKLGVEVGHDDTAVIKPVIVAPEDVQ